MKSILVTIIGDQILPNYLFFKKFPEDFFDSYLFITTKWMEEKDKVKETIRNYSITNDKFKVVFVSAEFPIEIKNQLQSSEITLKDSKYFINLTSGAKTMAIGLYQFFSSPAFSSISEIFYISIVKNEIFRIYPSELQSIITTDFQISLVEYLSCYAMSIEYVERKNQLLHSKAFTKNVAYYFFEYKNFDEWNDPIYKLRRSFNQSINKKSRQFRVSSGLKPIIQNLSYPLETEKNLNVRDVEYLIGGWLEEYVFSCLAQKLNLSSSHIQKGLKIQRQNSKGKMVENEFDVVFVKENTLHIIECKTRINTRLVDDILNKLQALRQEMGLRVKAYLFTSSILKPKTRSRIEKRASLYHIELYDQADFLNNFEKFNP